MFHNETIQGIASMPKRIRDVNFDMKEQSSISGHLKIGLYGSIVALLSNLYSNALRAE